MDGVSVELQATCAALGYYENGQYFKEPDCLETVKDLIRFLKREDETCEIRRQLGQTQILQKDLVPIIKQYKDDRVLLETVLRLMVNLTQPAILCFQNRIPEDKTTRNQFMEVESHLQAYKEAFSDEALFGVLTKKLGDLLQLEWEDRLEEDRLLVERILLLLRNILHVAPNAVKEQRTDDDASIHDQVLWALHVSGMEDLLLYLASSDSEKQFALHVLEIISLMFREQTPEQLASAGGPRAQSERQKDEQELAMIREQEKAEKRAQVIKNSSRHSRFGGTYTVANVKSISSRPLIVHSAPNKAANSELSFDKNKRPRRRPKNRLPIKDDEMTRRSTLCIRIFLKEFCVQFLENCYNPLMYAVKDILVRSRAQENDETYYLWAMRFFMEFNRKHHFRVDLVGETMSVQVFHYIQTNMMTFHEMIMTNKKEAKIWARRLHLAVRAYYELLQSLYMMTRSKDAAEKDSAGVIQSNVFYMMEYRDIFLLLLKNFNETRQSRAFLRDLVESTHLFIKMLEVFTSKHSHLVVQKKKTKRGKKKKQNKAPAPATNTGPVYSQVELDDKWEDISSDLSAIFQGRAEGELPTDVAPFDAASQVEDEQHRIEALVRVQTALREQRAPEAIALFRAAKDIWPDRAEFGTPDMSVEDEFMALREIFYADIPREAPAAQPEPVVEEEDEEEDEEEMTEERAEVEFNFNDFLKRFVSPQVVRAYILLLAQHRRNTPLTNHAAVKMLHRIGFDMCTPPMLFQASLFRVLQQILCEPACQVKQYDELRNFAKHVVRKFFEVAATNKKVFMELFFWKNVKESMEITEGYGSVAESRGKAKQQWSEEQDDELRRLYEEYQGLEEAERGEMDVADYIMMHLIDQTRTRRQIIKHLAYLGIIESAKDIKNKKRQITGRQWNEEEEDELRRLYDEHKDSLNPMGGILDNLAIKRSRRVVLNKLKELGLVEEGNDMKRKKKGGKEGGNPWNKPEDGRVLPTWSSSEDDDDEERIRRNQQQALARELQEMEEGGAGEGGAQRRRHSSSSSSSSSVSSIDSDVSLVDDDDGEGSDGGSPKPKRKSPKSSRSRKRAPKANMQSSGGIGTKFQIQKAAKKVIDEGLQGAVDWLKQCLERTADDKEEEEDEEHIPMVPITDEQEDAMENQAFQTLLKRVGVKPPANEQERFWRITGTLTIEQLRSNAASLVPSSNTPCDDESDEEGANSQGDSKKPPKKSDKKKNARLEMLRAMVQERKESGGKKRSIYKKAKKPASDSSDSDSDNNMDDLPESQGQSQGQARSNEGQGSSQGRQQGSDDEELSQEIAQQHRSKRLLSSNSSAGEESEHNTSPMKKPMSKRIRVQIQTSDEEEEEEMEEETPATTEATESEDKRGGTELQTFPATALSLPLSDSDDSDLDDHIPIKLAAKRAAILSDDDDE